VSPRCPRRAFLVAALAVPAMPPAWSSLAFFHDDQYRGDLIRLGRIEGGVEPLRMRGEFPLPLELITE
jgi:hypothetical protein